MVAEEWVRVPIRVEEIMFEGTYVALASVFKSSTFSASDAHPPHRSQRGWSLSLPPAVKQLRARAVGYARRTTESENS